MKNPALFQRYRELFFLCMIILSFICSRPVYLHARESILVIRSSEKAFEDVVKGLTDELENNFSVYELVPDDKTTKQNIKDKIRKISPKLVVLMDNTSINLFKEYQDNLGDTAACIPSISAMGVLIKRMIKEIRNSSGIEYEIPIVTAAINMRELLNIPLRKIGVVHRDFMHDFIMKNREYCRQEDIEIVAYRLPENKTNYKSGIKKGLKKLFKQDKVDALWVPNDNALLKPNLIRWAWQPLIRKYKIPVIVGVETLVNPRLKFGTYAVLPDHVALGGQIAEMVYQVKENGWSFKESRVEPPISVIKVLNYKMAEKQFGISEEEINNVDKILK
jgi:hypothetical protein